MTEKEFNNNLIGPIQFSLACSKILHEKAVNEKIKEFALFEIAETTVMTSVLKDLGTIMPELNEENKALFSKIESTGTGGELDSLYINAQLDNHRSLRDLTEEYLGEAPTEHLVKEESEGKHLAKLSLLMFNKHVAIAERISKELAG